MVEKATIRKTTSKPRHINHISNIVSHKKSVLLPASGTYALIMQCFQSSCVQVGRFGSINLENGYYIYIGSAFGPGGVKARVSRHLIRKINKHWHIDYITTFCKIKAVWYSYGPIKREHLWVQTLANMKNSRQPFPGFGATDHRGYSHLFAFEQSPSLKKFEIVLRKKQPEHDSIYTFPEA